MNASRAEVGARYYARPAADDEANSMDVFEYGRLNDAGGPYCVHAAISPEQAEHFVRTGELL